MPEWLKGTGCKPVGYAYVGSNPTPSTIYFARGLFPACGRGPPRGRRDAPGRGGSRTCVSLAGCSRPAAGVLRVGGAMRRVAVAPGQGFRSRVVPGPWLGRFAGDVGCDGWRLLPDTFFTLAGCSWSVAGAFRGMALASKSRSCGGHRIMAITLAFQARDAGSIPAARSNLERCKRSAV